MYTPEQLRNLSGEQAYKQPPVGGQYFDTVTVGKTDGNFYLTEYSKQKDTRPDPIKLPDTLVVPILRLRRKIQRWNKSEHRFDLMSVEYDAGTQLVPTTHGVMSEKDARALEPKPSVQVILYVLLNNRIVKLSVGGSSTYFPDDTTDMRLYTYMQSFEEDETLATFNTVIKTKKRTYATGRTVLIDGVEEPVLDTTYDMIFSRGDAVVDLTPVGDALTSLPDILKENDTRDLKFLCTTKSERTPAVATGAPAYPVDDINPADIPF